MPKASSGRRRSTTELRRLDVAERCAATMNPAEPPGFGLWSWTSRSCIPSSRRSARASGSRALPKPFRPLRASPSRRCRSCSQRCTRSSTVRSSCWRPRIRTRAMPPRARRGFSARNASQCFRAAASTGARASTPHRISSGSGLVRSTSSRPAGSSSPRQPHSPSRCRRSRRVPSRSASPPNRRSASSSFPSRSRSPATSA